MSDPSLNLQKQRSESIQIQQTQQKEQEISALQRKLGLSEGETQQEQSGDALQEVRSKVAENMPMTLSEKMIQWRMGNEGTTIRKGKRAKGKISPEKMTARNNLQIFRSALAMPVSADQKERALEAKHIRDGLLKMKEACEAYRRENPGKPETDEQREDLEFIQKLENEILAQEEDLNNGLDELVESKEQFTGSWISALAGNGIDL